VHFDAFDYVVLLKIDWQIFGLGSIFELFKVKFSLIFGRHKLAKII